MKKRNYSFALAFLILCPLLILLIPFHTVDCSYSNYNGTFTFEEVNAKGRDFDMAIYKFNEFKKLDQKDTTLYRLCDIELWKFWDWRNYFFTKKFGLPYKSWNEINARRGPVIAKSGFQDF